MMDPRLLAPRSPTTFEKHRHQRTRSGDYDLPMETNTQAMQSAVTSLKPLTAVDTDMAMSPAASSRIDSDSARRIFVSIYNNEEEFPISFLSDLPQNDIKNAIMDACNSMRGSQIDSESIQLEDGHHGMRRLSDIQFQTNQRYRIDVNSLPLLNSTQTSMQAPQASYRSQQKTATLTSPLTVDMPVTMDNRMVSGLAIMDVKLNEPLRMVVQPQTQFATPIQSSMESIMARNITAHAQARATVQPVMQRQEYSASDLMRFKQQHQARFGLVMNQLREMARGYLHRESLLEQQRSRRPMRTRQWRPLTDSDIAMGRRSHQARFSSVMNEIKRFGRAADVMHEIHTDRDFGMAQEVGMVQQSGPIRIDAPLPSAWHATTHEPVIRQTAAPVTVTHQITDIMETDRRGRDMKEEILLEENRPMMSPGMVTSPIGTPITAVMSSTAPSSAMMSGSMMSPARARPQQQGGLIETSTTVVEQGNLETHRRAYSAPATVALPLGQTNTAPAMATSQTVAPAAVRPSFTYEEAMSRLQHGFTLKKVGTNGKVYERRMLLEGDEFMVKGRHHTSFRFSELRAIHLGRESSDFHKAGVPPPAPCCLWLEFPGRSLSLVLDSQEERDAMASLFEAAANGPQAQKMSSMGSNVGGMAASSAIAP
eukprot:GILJ01013039.1.p1 GENE.GILJ01013039.1~~GILJ01013039.1.p1  ORF type:complete len:652 (-),score=120.36 GILJ01013039.1:132-2087(-)